MSNLTIGTLLVLAGMLIDPVYLRINSEHNMMVKAAGVVLVVVGLYFLYIGAYANVKS